ncbi:MAG: O-antigen ligase family protein, partial [Eubacterium sp.]|nr:O-antigen ligase family protein [Eubacterium sp.]
DGGVKDAFVLSDVPNSISFTFMYDNNEWKYYTPYGKLIKLHAVERFGFQNSENMASRRGYIWSRSIPLMKTYWFKGIGPNCFIIAFPNDDFVGSKRVGNKTLLVDKPHNTFLQTYIQTGGISAIAYLGLWILYVIQCARLFWRKKLSNNMYRIAFGIFIGTISYSIVSLTNDAVIGVQSSYWILLGLGYAINRIIQKQ